MQTCFEQKFRCARTKCVVTFTDIFAPFSLTEIEKHSKDALYITLLTDTSNHRNVKLFPVLIQFFQPYEGFQGKLIEFKLQPRETSNIFMKYSTEILGEPNLNSRLASFCDDYTNNNFGGLERKGINNISRALNAYLGRDLTEVRCSYLIVFLQD